MDLNEARKYSVNRTHFNLDRIPLIPHLKFRTPEEWKALEQKYILGIAGRPAINSLKEEIGKKFPMKTPRQVIDTKPIIQNIDSDLLVPHNVMRLANKPELFNSVGHASTFIKTPSGDFTLFDPHGLPLESPRSQLKNIVEPIKRFIGNNRLEQCNMFGKFQGFRGTCSLWAELRALHPEKTNDEFYEMLLQSIAKSGFDKAFPIEKNLETIDLIPIAIFEQLVEEGRPNFDDVSKRIEWRKGLGRKICKTCGLSKIH